MDAKAPRTEAHGSGNCVKATCCLFAFQSINQFTKRRTIKSAKSAYLKIKLYIKYIHIYFYLFLLLLFADGSVPCALCHSSLSALCSLGYKSGNSRKVPSVLRRYSLAERLSAKRMRSATEFLIRINNLRKHLMPVIDNYRLRFYAEIGS